MERTIVVGLDGLSLAEAALPFVEHFAKAIQARVCLVEVARIGELPIDTPEEPPASSVQSTERLGPTISHDLTDELRAKSEAEHYLHNIAAQLGTNGVLAEALVVVGDPATVLVEEAKSRNAELIILATHGRGGLGRSFYGSVADAVMRRSSVPVLLVPLGWNRAWPHDRPPRILVPLDGSIVASDALAPAQRLVFALGAELSLVQVIEPLSYSYVTPYLLRDLEAEETTARAYLANVAHRLQARGLAVRERVLHGPVVPTLIDWVQQDQIDLIVVASHGSGGVIRLLLGSVASGIVQRSSVPILVVHSKASRRALDISGMPSADKSRSVRSPQ